MEVVDTGYLAPWCNPADLALTENVTDPQLAKLLGLEIGKGKSNTLLMMSGCKSGAANVASTISRLGFKDWFLPSLMELNEVCKFARYKTTGGIDICSKGEPQPKIRGYFVNSFYRASAIGATDYWSSSEVLATNPKGHFAWAINFFASEPRVGLDKKGMRSVLAIRYFGAKGDGTG